jgi:hypothetical protein
MLAAASSTCGFTSHLHLAGGMQSCSKFYKSPGQNVTAPLTSVPDSQPLYLTASLPALARIKLNFKHLIQFLYFKMQTDKINE